jgi:hypothetical protein
MAVDSGAQFDLGINTSFCNLKRSNKKTFSEFTGAAISDRASAINKHHFINILWQSRAAR